MFTTPVISTSKGLDWDVKQFISATTITDVSQIAAINTLVSSAKSHGWWNKCIAIYPMIGGSLSTCKFNLRDPRDADTSYRLTFINSPTVTTNGVDWNGTDQRADTNFYPSSGFTSANNAHISYYSTKSNGVVNGTVEMGFSAGQGADDDITISILGGFASSTLAMNSTSEGGTVNTDSTGFYIGNIDSPGASRLYKNGYPILNTSAGRNLNTHNFPIGASYNRINVVYNYTDRTCGFASIGYSLTSSEVAYMTSDVQTYMETMNRGRFLDMYVTGATAAFSMYRIKSNYTGNCLRIRRSSDDTELDVPFSGNYIDTATITGFVGSNSAYVTKWYDQSGNGNDAYQTTNANQPRIVNAGTIDTYNSRVCIKTLSGDRRYLLIPNITGSTVMNGYLVSNQQSNLSINFVGGDLSHFSHVSESGSGDTGLYANFGTPSMYVNDGSAFAGTTRGDVFNTLSGNKIININGDVSNWLEFSLFGYNYSPYMPDSLTGEVVIWTSDQTSIRRSMFANMNSRWGVY